MEFFRQECWSGLPFPSPGDLPNPGIEPGSLALQVNSLTILATKPHRDYEERHILSLGLFTGRFIFHCMLSLQFIFILVFFPRFCPNSFSFFFLQWHKLKTHSPSPLPVYPRHCDSCVFPRIPSSYGCHDTGYLSMSYWQRSAEGWEGNETAGSSLPFLIQLSFQQSLWLREQAGSCKDGTPTWCLLQFQHPFTLNAPLFLRLLQAQILLFNHRVSGLCLFLAKKSVPCSRLALVLSTQPHFTSLLGKSASYFAIYTCIVSLFH